MKMEAILGGTFDPPHYGHLEIAKRALDQFSLSKVLFIPAGNPWHKGGEISSYKDRFKMTELLVQDFTSFEVSDIENDTINPTYTIETLKQIAKVDTHYLILGADVAKFINTWKDYEDIFEYAHMLIAPRDGVSEQEVSSIFPGPYTIIEGDNVDLNSTTIRSKMMEKDTLLEMLPQKIIDYITENSLYL